MDVGGEEVVKARNKMTKVLYVVAAVWVALFVWQTIAHAAPAAMLCGYVL